MIARLLAQRALRVILMAALFPVPFTNLLSGALPALISQRAGWRQGAIDTVLAVALLAALAALSGGEWWLAAGSAAVLWGSAVLAGQFIGRYGSMTLACQTLVAVVCAAVGLANLVVRDPQAVWQPWLEENFRKAGLPGLDGLPSERIGEIARLMHGVIGVGLLISVLLSVVIGTWLAARVGGHGLRSMFVRISMGRALAALALLVAVIGVAAGLPVGAGNLLLVLGTGLALQGLAVVHWVGQQRQWPAAWPLVLYGPLVLIPPLAGIELLLLAVLGFVDNWHALRRARPDMV
jgi:hypothetical protein